MKIFKKKEGNLSLRLPVNILALVRKCSQAEGKSVSEIVRKLLIEKLENDGLYKPCQCEKE